MKIDLGPAQLSRRWIDQASERLVAYKRASRLHSDRDLELYKLELEDRFGQIPGEDEESSRFFELLKVRIRAQALAVNEVSTEKGRLKVRVSPQTPLDPVKLMAWVSRQKGAQFNPDGTVLIPAPAPGADTILQAQELLAAWALL